MARFQIIFARTKLPSKTIGKCILIICFAGLWLGGATIVRAQSFQAGGYFTPVIPTGEFRDNVPNNGYGAGGYILVRLRDSPFLAGGDLGIVVYGSESHDEPLSTTIPGVVLNVRTSNNIFLGHSMLRIQPHSGRVLPYFDGLIGLKQLFTRTSITSDSSDGELAGTTNLSDTAFSYGFGAGVQVPLARTGRVGIMLDGNVRYLRGGRADYLKKGSISDVNGQAVFDVLSSRTDVVGIQIGVSFHF